MSNPQKTIVGSWGRRIFPHPLTPLLYFSPFKPSNTPEIDFNTTAYFASKYDCDEGLYMEPTFLRDQLSDSLDFRTTTYIPKSLMEESIGNIRPAYYPDLSDLNGYLHKGVGAFAKWLCKNTTSADFIPREIVPIFDLKPEFDPDRLPLYTLPLQETHIFIGATTATFHVMEVRSLVKIIRINVFSCVTTKLKVKYHRVSLYGSEADVHEPSPKFLPMGSHVILWNARNVHRPSFVETFYQLFNAYSPSAVVITEARFDESTTEFVKYELRATYNVQGFGGQNGYSEVLLIWNVKALAPWIIKRGKSYFGHQLGVDLESLKSPFSEPSSPYSPYRGGEPDDDPTIHDYNDHLTPSPFSASSDDSPRKPCDDPTIDDYNDHLTP